MTIPSMGGAAASGIGEFIRNVGFPIAAYIGLFAYMFYAVEAKHNDIIDNLKYNQAVIIANFYSNHAICLNNAEQSDGRQSETWKQRCNSAKDQMEKHLETFRVRNQ